MLPASDLPPGTKWLDDTRTRYCVTLQYGQVGQWTRYCDVFVVEETAETIQLLLHVGTDGEADGEHVWQLQC